MTIHHSFKDLKDVVSLAAKAVKPGERINVAQAAEKYRYLKNPGSFEGYWDNTKAPYLVEPMETLTDRLFHTTCFIGPAQCGKTDMFLNYVAHAVKCDPADMSLIQTSNVTARDFSLTRIDRLHRHSPEVGAEMINHTDADNTFDKQYRSGMILRISWPSINELSGKPVPRLWLTDYDRMDQDIAGEGTPYFLARARTTSFKRYGKVIVETSPGFEVTDPQWVPKTRHEAPPVMGGLAVYNSGDRRRWYWRCVSCGNAFEPHRDLMKWPVSEDILESAAGVHLECPYCEQKYYHHDTKVPGKDTMNQLAINGGHARWLKDGEFWNQNGEVTGQGVRASVASFWLFGVAATFANWPGLVEDTLNAEKTFEENMDEGPLKTVINTKWGEVYVTKAQQSARLPEELKSRALDWGVKVVPVGVRFLIATIDVQKNRFVVQVHGIGSDDIWIVDRFEIKYSKRAQEDRPDQLHYVNPAAHEEDWRLLVTEVMMKTYPLADDPDRHMAIYHTFCDSGGKAGVTPKAYDFFRWLANGYEEGTDEETKTKYPWKPHLVARFQLLKGDPNPKAPSVHLRFPDSQRKDRNAGARGEIPILFLNTNMLKDGLDGMLARKEAGGRINFPKWLGTNFYKELCVEIRDKKKGEWQNPNNYRNESWDLLVYCLAGLLHRMINWRHINWDEPPGWAEEWEHNDMVFRINGEEAPFESEGDEEYDLARLGAALG